MEQINLFKLIIVVIIEKLHRYTFDNLYKQDYKYKFKVECIGFIYRYLAFKIPDFRQYINKWYPILEVSNGLYFKLVKHINYKRYSSY